MKKEASSAAKSLSTYEEERMCLSRQSFVISGFDGFKAWNTYWSFLRNRIRILIPLYANALLFLLEIIEITVAKNYSMSIAEAPSGNLLWFSAWLKKMFKSYSVAWFCVIFTQISSMN